MAANGKPPVLVIVQLTGGNDFMNTLVPYTNPIYYDSRPTVVIPQDEVLPINDELGFNPNAAPLKEIFDDGKMAVVQGIGYPNSSRSHFRGMDIWHTCEPVLVGKEGWVGRAIRAIDPNKENVLTAINFGKGLPRAVVAPGVAVTAVDDLDNVGLMTGIGEEAQRAKALDMFKKMYAPAIGTGPVMEYLSQTGNDVLAGADVLKTAPAMYSSEVEYADNPIAQTLKSVAQVMCAGLGTRVYYARHASFDTHSAELLAHSKLWQDVSTAIGDFTADLTEHGLAEDTLILVWSEFGRRIKDNGAGCDHGSGGVAFVIGDSVNGGFYGEFPSLREGDQLDGDLHFNNDFRSTYSTIVDKWLGLDPDPITNGKFEQFDFISN